ncbi:putative uncharacterized protein DDB_G0282129, partial [Eurytemora carolleeae]|uniref:putative uncharacterized protein DDB_G0282129 n=1 Tax=Eurytemora carolleeae TaxID=1294199 RepID=UPI000C767883
SSCGSPTRPPPPPAITTILPPPPPPRQNSNPRNPPPAPPTRPSPSRDEVTASRIVNQQFSQFPNFQSHQNSDENLSEAPRSSQSQHVNKNGFDVVGLKSSQQEEKKDTNQNDFRVSSRQENSAPAPSSGLTIEEFLSRYPEVKRLSSRFNENGEDLAAEPEEPRDERKHDRAREDDRNQNQNHLGNGQIHQVFIEEQRNENDHELIRNSEDLNNRKESFTAIFNTNQEVTTPSAPSHITPKQRRPAQKNQSNQEKNGNRRPGKKQNKNPKPSVNEPDVLDDPEYPLYTDYDYYYDQLVPEHERFFQLPKIEVEIIEENTAKPESFQVFTHFSLDTEPSRPQLPPPPPPVEVKPVQQTPRTPKAPKITSSQNSITPVKQHSSADMSGPFGFVEKGTFFIDDTVSGFPERIDMVYQGFVWAFDVYYPDQDTQRHGGIHTILKDKVKKETVNLKNDYIIRITGRASPYNINRLTFHTANGKEFGPWGDRHSDESADFDVSAPAGYALSFFSGTIDFGVPLRSVGFHWKKI